MREEVVKEIKRRLERHPGDSPWSCIDCYHNRPCIDKEILLAALANLGAEDRWSRIEPKKMYKV